MQSSSTRRLGGDNLAFVDLDTAPEGLPTPAAGASAGHAGNSATAGVAGEPAGPKPHFLHAHRQRSTRQRSELDLRALGVSARTVEEYQSDDDGSPDSSPGNGNGNASRAVPSHPALSSPPTSFLRPSSMPHLRGNQPGAVNTGHHGVGRRTASQPGMVLPATGEREVTSHPSMGTLISFGSMPNGMMEFQSYTRHSSLDSEAMSRHDRRLAAAGGASTADGALQRGRTTAARGTGTILHAIRTASQRSLLSLADSVGGSP